MRLRKALLLLGDVLLFYLSLYAMLRIRFGGSYSYNVWKDHIFPFTVVFLVWIIIFYVWDMYNLSFEVQKKKFVGAMMMAILVAMAMFYVASGTKISPKTNLVVTFAIYATLLFAWRAFISRIYKAFWKYAGVAVIGIDEHSLEIIKRIKNKNESGYRVLYYLDLNSKKTCDQLWDVQKIEKIDDLISLVEEKRLDIIVVSRESYPSIVRSLYRFIDSGVSVYHLSTFWEEFEESIPVYATNDIWFLENIREDKKRIFDVGKRLFDLILMLILSPFAIVISVMIALAIRVGSPGNVLIRQQRVGKYNRLFTLYKFRTMYHDAEKNGPQWTEKNDQRVTRLGKLLRAVRLDEIPQMLNIVKGEMSVVGPRPERPEFVQELAEKIPHYNFRHLTKPGVTGWAQIKAPYAASIEESAKKLEYDLYYIKNRSIVLDFMILLQTLPVILERRGR